MSKMSRIVLAAPKSGSGKTMITCGIIEALKKKGLKVAAMKCGPDYIDPMFHRRVLGVPSGNLDTFFTDEKTTAYLLGSRAKGMDITIIEGVMGYYDGIGGEWELASTYEVAKVTKTPVVLVVDAKGAGLTLAAVIRGLMELRRDSNIKGVILNRVSESYYGRIKSAIERECHVRVLGFLPDLKDLEIPSRHLGLVSPEEMEQLHGAWVDTVAEELQAHVSLDMLLDIAEGAEPLDSYDIFSCNIIQKVQNKPISIGIARDEAFTFSYSENIQLLEEMGAELCYFSPLHDSHLPENIKGLILWGGYPERYAKELSDNITLRMEIKSVLDSGMPCLAECGGFLYLQKTLEGTDGKIYDMAGVLPGEGYKTHRLCRFGYIELEPKAEISEDRLLLGGGFTLRGHEFHYWDCTENGSDFQAWKPTAEQKEGGIELLDKSASHSIYDCMVHTETMLAGFPHFYYYSNPEIIRRYLKKCVETK